jgi:hypothetical protein
VLQPNLAAQVLPAITPVRIAPCSSSSSLVAGAPTVRSARLRALTMTARGAGVWHLRVGRQVSGAMDEFDERGDCRYSVAISPVP